MRIAVAGGTGLVGSLLGELRAGAMSRSVLARSAGVDLTTGQDSEAALDGADAVVDVSNVATTRRRPAEKFFTRAPGTCSRGRAGRVRPPRRPLDRRGGPARTGATTRPSSPRSGWSWTSGVPGRCCGRPSSTSSPGSCWTRMPGAGWRSSLVMRVHRSPLARSPRPWLALARVGGARGMAPELAGPQVHESPELARRVLGVRGARRRAGAPGPVARPGRAVLAAEGPAAAHRRARAAARPSTSGWRGSAPCGTCDERPGCRRRGGPGRRYALIGRIPASTVGPSVSTGAGRPKCQPWP